MKKIYSIFIIFGILMLISNAAFATYYADDEKRVNAFESALDTYMQTFMTEEIPEKDRIKEYIFTGCGMDTDGNKLKVTISINVTPVNENNTSWNKTTNYCFASFTKVDGEYVLDKISRYPDYYDEFLVRFEEYKENNPTTIESTQIQAEELTNNLANQEIDKMTKIIFVSCLIVLLVMVIFIITKFIKHRK